MSLGHKRIAFIHGHNNSIVTRSRISQFCNTMAFHGLEVPEGYLRASLYDDIVLTRTIVKEMLELPEPPHAIREIATAPASRAANNLFFMLHPPILINNTTVNSYPS
jgi:DNA-binding LacI/PurR family transcriptional regulator